MKDHRDHDFEFCKKAAPTKKKQNLLKNWSPLKEQRESLANAVEDVQTTKQEVKAQGDSVANSIQDFF